MCHVVRPIYVLRILNVWICNNNNNKTTQFLLVLRALTTSLSRSPPTPPPAPLNLTWTTAGNYSCLKVDLIFTRDRAFYFTTVFIPGIILVTSSFITFWLEWNAVPARSMIGNWSVYTLPWLYFVIQALGVIKKQIDFLIPSWDTCFSMLVFQIHKHCIPAGRYTFFFYISFVFQIQTCNSNTFK